MSLDPNPGDRYQPRDEASVYIAGYLIREQPEHPPEVLAKAQRIPPGVAARRGVTPTFNTALDDSIAIRLAEISAGGGIGATAAMWIHRNLSTRRTARA